MRSVQQALAHSECVTLATPARRNSSSRQSWLFRMRLGMASGREEECEMLSWSGNVRGMFPAKASAFEQGVSLRNDRKQSARARRRHDGVPILRRLILRSFLVVCACASEPRGRRGGGCGRGAPRNERRIGEDTRRHRARERRHRTPPARWRARGRGDRRARRGSVVVIIIFGVGCGIGRSGAAARDARCAFDEAKSSDQQRVSGRRSRASGEEHERAGEGLRAATW